MMAGMSPTTAARVGAGLSLALLTVVFVPGCGDGYTPELTYTPRIDPLVESLPTDKPAVLDSPGQLEQTIAALDKKSGGKLIDPAKIPAKNREELAKVLNETFGTPARPKVEADNAAEMKLDPATLAEGSKLYRRHCLHCHGLNGDGRGPTAPWVHPHPRDYRLGKFKFTSTGQDAGQRRAMRDDLRRTVKYGIEGTSMPSFASLEDGEIEAMISYVIHLSVRGKAEFDALKELSSSPEDTDVPDEVAKSVKRNLRWWGEAEKSPISVPAPPPYVAKPGVAQTPEEIRQLKESIRRGYHEFLTGQARCVSCHNDFGRANDYLYDEWGTIIRPANLTAGMYRGGRRPVDLFYRVHSGVNGAQMPGFANLGDKIWDIVNFIQALPYPAMLDTPVDDKDVSKGTIRERIYGKKS